jgi:hypothetical protein
MVQDGAPKKRRPAWAKGFLAALAEKGVVAYACRAVGKGRTEVYRLRSADPDFADDWDAALEVAYDLMEEEGWRRAVRGVEKPVFGSGGTGVGTVRVGEVQEYSDTLLIFMLKGGRPGKYRERYEHTGKDGGAIEFREVKKLNDVELDREIAERQARIAAAAAGEGAAAEGAAP